MHGPTYSGFFSVVNITLLHHLQLVESTDREEPWIERSGGYRERTINYTQVFLCVRSGAPAPAVFQQSIELPLGGRE